MILNPCPADRVIHKVKAILRSAGFRHGARTWVTVEGIDIGYGMESTKRGFGPASGAKAAWIGVDEQADKVPLKVYFVKTISYCFETDSLATEGPPDDANS